MEKSTIIGLVLIFIFIVVGMWIIFWAKRDLDRIKRK